MKQLLERVWEHSKKNPNGFTLNIETMAPIKFGICVAYQETQNNFGKDGLKKALSHALSHQKIVGGWQSQKGFYFDSVRIFKNSELHEALEFAKLNNQIAIFDLTNLKEITIK